MVCGMLILPQTFFHRHGERVKHDLLERQLHYPFGNAMLSHGKPVKGMLCRVEQRQALWLAGKPARTLDAEGAYRLSVLSAAGSVR